MRINAHGHILPYPEQIPAFMREKQVFWIDADRKFMRNASWQRPVTDPSFFLYEKLEWMDKNNIDHGVMLNLSQLYCNGMPRELARDVIRFQNDFNAGVMSQYPAKFTCGFVVQPLYLDDALAEMERCVKDLEMSVMCLPTHFLDEKGQWKSVAHGSTDAIWSYADELGLAVEIHPYDADRVVNLENKYWRFHLVWMCAMTADCYHVFTLRDMAVKYPQVRTCFAHGNQFAQVNYGRRQQGFKGRPDLFEGFSDPGQTMKSDNVYFDTLVHDADVLKLLIDRQSVRQIVAGLDDPYPLGEMETVEGCYPGKVIDEAHESGYISKEELDQIWCDNVVRWLGKDVNKAN